MPCLRARIVLRSLTFTAFVLALTLPTAVYAQQKPQASTLVAAQTTPNTGRKVAARSATPAVREPQSVARFLAGVSRLADTIVLADRSVAREMILPPLVPVRSDSVEQILNQIVTSLPQGTIWLKGYLPNRGPDPLTRWNPDSIADYLLLQSELFGRAGNAPLAGSVEIMGNWVTGDTAHSLTESLRLRPVYVLVNPVHRDIVVQASTVAPQTESTAETKPVP